MLSVKDLTEPVLVLKGDGWHEGIIGIIASRIKEKFNKPTIIISIKNDIGKASARSILGFDIGACIIGAVQKGLLIKGGGHKMAGGFTINKNKIEEFKKFLINKFRNLNMKLYEEKKIFIDSEISSSAINLEFFNRVNNLAPFGSGNTEPKFSLNNLKVLNSKIVGENHIKSILLGPDGSNVSSIAFNATESDIGAYLLDKKGKSLNIVGKLNLNEWKGIKKVEFIIEDISVTKKRENVVPSSIG